MFMEWAQLVRDHKLVIATDGTCLTTVVLLDGKHWRGLRNIHLRITPDAAESTCDIEFLPFIVGFEDSYAGETDRHLVIGHGRSGNGPFDGHFTRIIWMNELIGMITRFELWARAGHMPQVELDVLGISNERSSLARARDGRFPWLKVTDVKH